jgi:ArsR family transcriptional regulator
MNNLWVFDENKLLILEALYKCKQDKQLCGCDLTDKLDIPKNLLSYHIKILRENGYVEEEKCGQKKNYFLADNKLDKIETILQAVELI